MLQDLFLVRNEREFQDARRCANFPLTFHPVDSQPVQFESRLRKVGGITAMTASSRTGFRAVPTSFRDLYSLSLTVTGSTARCCASREATSRPGTGSLYHLHDLEWLDVSANFKTIGLLFDRELVDRELEVMTGQRPDGTIDFLPVADLGSGGLQRFARSVRSFHAAALREDPPAGLDLPLLQELLVQQLLSLWPRANMASTAPEADASSASTLGRAREFIAAHLTTPLCVADVACAAGVSTRALQMAFRRELGQSPVSFILAERLERAHADLSRGDDIRSVSQVAYQCGFLHMSDFSRRYRERFGCTPTQTRRER